MILFCIDGKCNFYIKTFKTSRRIIQMEDYVQITNYGIRAFIQRTNQIRNKNISTALYSAAFCEISMNHRVSS